jgi:hypothetical protein
VTGSAAGSSASAVSAASLRSAALPSDALDLRPNGLSVLSVMSSHSFLRPPTVNGQEIGVSSICSKHIDTKGFSSYIRSRTRLSGSRRLSERFEGDVLVFLA